MNLDPRTLLFSIFVVYALSVLSLFVTVIGGSAGGKRDGMSKWALAMLLETLLWVLIAARGIIPDVFSIVVANGLKAASHALILAAICEFQQRQAPRWHYFVPVALMLLMVTILHDDIKARFVWGGLIYGFQMVLIARALIADKENRAGRAWRLLFAGVIGIVIVLGVRAAVAIFGHSEFGEPQSSVVLQPVQLLTYIAVMSTAVLGSIGFVLMVKERTDREIMHLAMTDSLTQIPNRRALMDYARRALSRRSGFPLALLMIDVDHFKEINDTHGHPLGDKVLCEIASLLTGRLRGYDFLGRYGGEEFCVIAPDTDAEGARTLAEHLRVAIASAPISIDSGKFPVSISIGISLCPSKGRGKLDELLAEADAALYNAKQSGRNRSVCFGAVLS
jgi:diguanylate cyclase (GGDEF)-like protein